MGIFDYFPNWLVCILAGVGVVFIFTIFFSLIKSFIKWLKKKIKYLKQCYSNFEECSRFATDLEKLFIDQKILLEILDNVYKPEEDEKSNDFLHYGWHIDKVKERFNKLNKDKYWLDYYRER